MYANHSEATATVPVSDLASHTHVHGLFVDPMIQPGISSQPQGGVTQQEIEAAETRLLYLARNRLDSDPIENDLSKMKAILRKPASESVNDLWNAIGKLIDAFTPTECANSFTAAGCKPD